MRLPAVAIAAVFAGGAVLGQAEWFAQRASSHTFLTAGFVTVGVLLGAGIVLARFGRLFPDAGVSVLSWAILGILGAGIAEQPRPADYVLSLVEAGASGFEDAILPRRDIMDWTGSRVGCLDKSGKAGARKKNSNFARSPWKQICVGCGRNAIALAGDSAARNWIFAEEQRFSGSAPEVRRAHFYASRRCGEASGERDPQRKQRNSAPRGRLESWSSREQEFHHAGISGSRRPARRSDKRGGRQSLRVPQPGIARTARNGGRANSTDRSRRSSTHLDGWRETRNQLLCGVSGNNGEGPFSAIETTKSTEARRAVAGIPPPPDIRDSFCTARTKTRQPLQKAIWPG